MIHHREGRISNENAFTLLEILFVLIIIGFLTAGFLKRWDELVERYGRMAVLAGVAELNYREKMVWAKAVVSKEGWQGDAALFSELDTDLGDDFMWMDKRPTITGGHLAFQDIFTFDLSRTPSTAETPGRWINHGP
jgi:prepilin-type N-terminal cleavage/methylation domain-containing protein